MLHVHYRLAKIELTPREGWIGNMPRGNAGYFPRSCNVMPITYIYIICGAGTKSSAVGVLPGATAVSSYILGRQYSAPGFCSRRWRGHEAAGLLLLRLTKWSLLLVAVVCFCSARQVLRELKAQRVRYVCGKER